MKGISVKMQELVRSSNSRSKSKHHYSCLLNLFIITGLLCIIYLLLSISISTRSNPLHLSVSLQDDSSKASLTSIDQIVFGIASNKNSWRNRQDFVKLWWKPNLMRGCVFLDSIPETENPQNLTSNSDLPPVCVSEDTVRFRYTYRGGLRSAFRVARVVLETVRLNHTNVRWFVFGDDDTVFFTENLVKTLSKYDHENWYYIGANSESYMQNRFFSFEMGFGGAGFAISYPLVKVLARVFDSCIERYPHLYGSDGRIYPSFIA